MNKIFSTILSAGTLLTLIGFSNSASAQLWYNGDFDAVSGLANELNTAVTDSVVYEDFNVTDPMGWTINSVFSNNLTDVTGITQANWSIRSGVSAGNGGTLVASGTGAGATESSTGRSGFGLNEATIEVSGLNVYLAPGTYWLSVTPIGFGSGRSFVSTTSGTNAIGTPAGNNANSFWTSSTFGSNFSDTAGVMGRPSDFSLGVRGNVGSPVPEPGNIALIIGMGVTATGFATRRRKK